MNESLEIEKSAFGGQSISHSGGKIIFIPFTIPGEKIKVSIVKNKSDYAIAEAVEILESSDDRINPECPNFGRCGGCDYLHMTYDREISEKVNITRESLIRIAKIPETMIPPISIIRRDRFHYRSHARIKHMRSATGFFGKDSHNVVQFPASGCLLLDRRINEAIKTTRFKLAETHIAVDSSCNIITPHNGDSIDITEETNGVIYRHSIDSFFQRNSVLRGEMINRVIEYTGDDHESTVLELGCGCGFFSIPLARKFRFLRGIDISDVSIIHAKHNAEANGVTNAVFEARDDATLSQDDSADIIIADPPRAGLSESTKNAI
ncbi:MAG TPA: methyltransferase domain-containing protein, partial [Spirochaetota bacterium]|nr:methyltransferase domain-containing protein [Spirochaetota bacterium]